MQPANGRSGGSSSTPLQLLHKNKPSLVAKPHKRSLQDGTKNDKTDKVKEYMERKFYEQFMPKRDANSRIRKLAVDKDTIRRAHGNYRKRLLKMDGGKTTSSSQCTSLSSGSPCAAQKPRKRKPTGLSSAKSEEICAMVRLQTCRSTRAERITVLRSTCILIARGLPGVARDAQTSDKRACSFFRFFQIFATCSFSHVTFMSQVHCGYRRQFG